MFSFECVYGRFCSHWFLRWHLMFWRHSMGSTPARFYGEVREAATWTHFSYSIDKGFSPGPPVFLLHKLIQPEVSRSKEGQAWPLCLRCNGNIYPQWAPWSWGFFRNLQKHVGDWQGAPTPAYSYSPHMGGAAEVSNKWNTIFLSHGHFPACIRRKNHVLLI